MKPKVLQEIDDLKDNLGGFKVGSFTRSTTDASGTQTITGVGFKPKAIAVLSVISAKAGRMSIGFSSGGIHKGVYDVHNAVADSFSATDSLIHIRQASAGAASYTGVLQSFDNDGFTIAWTKGTSIVDGETITVQYLVFK